jgi:hypothetical protein
MHLPILSRLLFSLCLLVGLFSFASSADAGVRFGPYEALTINSDVIRGVKVDDAGKIWLLLNPTYKEREIQLKISNQEGADYRMWFTGEPVLISPAGQGKQANQWTDWIETVAPYIEYWMDGQKILHLKKVA